MEHQSPAYSEVDLSHFSFSAIGSETGESSDFDYTGSYQQVPSTFVWPSTTSLEGSDLDYTGSFQQVPPAFVWPSDTALEGLPRAAHQRNLADAPPVYDGALQIDSFDFFQEFPGPANVPQGPMMQDYLTDLVGTYVNPVDLTQRIQGPEGPAFVGHPSPLELLDEDLWPDGVFEQSMVNNILLSDLNDPMAIEEILRNLESLGSDTNTPYVLFEGQSTEPGTMVADQLGPEGFHHLSVVDDESPTLAREGNQQLLQTNLEHINPENTASRTIADNDEHETTATGSRICRYCVQGNILLVAQGRPPRRTEFTRNAFKSHLQTHSPYKPFQCRGCGRRFRKLRDRNRHYDTTHCHERFYQCRIGECRSEFGRRDHATRHIGIKHPESNDTPFDLRHSFACTNCKATFATETAFRNHTCASGSSTTPACLDLRHRYLCRHCDPRDDHFSFHSIAACVNHMQQAHPYPARPYDCLYPQA